MNIAIAGAGLMGRLLAWQLLRRGHRVALYDSGDRSGEQSAAYVAAAMLAPVSEAVAHQAELHAWSRDAVPRWRALLDQLAEHADTPVMLREGGALVVAHELDRANLDHFQQQLRRKLADASAVETLDRRQLRELEPELGEAFGRALWLREEGCLDNRGLLIALAGAVDRLGGEWHEGCDVREVVAGRLVTARGTRECDLAIDTRGFGARGQLTDLRGVRGEVLWVQAPEVNLQRPVRLMHPRYSLYVAPKPESVYVIGATEIESESQAPVTVRSSLELLSALYSVHSGFAEAKLVGSYARCRPALPDNLPRVTSRGALLQVNGLYRHGYLLAPRLLQQALDTIEHTTRKVV